VQAESPTSDGDGVLVKTTAPLCSIKVHELTVQVTITRSVVQGSGIGPSAYLVYSMNLKNLSPYNSILKYADDTSILVPQHSSVSMQEEFQNVQTWSTANKLQINLNKTKAIVFRRPSLRNFITSQSLPFIEQLAVTKFMGIYISATFSTTVHVEHTLAVANQ